MQIQNDKRQGKTTTLPEFSKSEGSTTIPLQFESYQSFFIVFTQDTITTAAQTKNFAAKKRLSTLKGPWSVSFDPAWGGSPKVDFNNLVDWTSRPEKGIKYYSGIAVYEKNFDLPSAAKKGNSKLYLDLGEVKNLARVRLNGKDLGVVWTAPWRIDITGIAKQNGNKPEIEVANLWRNRLIGDEQFPDDGIKNGKFPEWLLKGEKRSSSRFTFTTYSPYKKDSPLLKSGLIGPVTIEQSQF